MMKLKGDAAGVRKRNDGGKAKDLLSTPCNVGECCCQLEYMKKHSKDKKQILTFKYFV